MVADTPPPAARSADPRVALGLAASLILTGLACRELLRFAPKTHLVVSLSGSVEEWFFEPSDSSPIVVLGLCGWLLWRRRRRLAALWGRRGSPVWTAALWALAAGLFGWAVRADAPDLQALALVPALLGAGHLLGGPAALRVMALPAATLLFAIPLPGPLLNHIVWPLQIWTADFTGFLLGLIGQTALVSGDRIIMDDALFAIIETCSGLRSMETLGMLAILMADLFGRRGLHAAALLLAALPVAFLINGLRCLGLIFNPHADIASVHNLQGIAMLLGGVLGLYFLDGLLERVLPPAARRSGVERRVRSEGGPRRALEPRVALVAGFAGLLFGLSWLPHFAVPSLAQPDPGPVVDRSLGDGWRSQHLETDWLFLGKADFWRHLHRRYARGADAVDVFVGIAEPGGRLRSYMTPKSALPGSGWIVEGEERGQIAGRAATLRELRHGTRRVLAAHWFEASPGLARESLRALLALDRSPATRRRIPAAVRLSTPLEGAAGRAGALDRLDRFARQLAPALNEMTTPRG